LPVRLICQKSPESSYTFVLQSKKKYIMLLKIKTMKKKILTLITALTLIISVSYASTTDRHVPANVASTFHSDFSFASNVNWELFNGYYKASFNEHGITLYAFYTAEGDFMGMAIYMLSDGLPASLKNQIKENYSGYWITDLFHFSVNNTPGYFVTLENADRKIMLKAEQNKGWSFYSEVKKN